MTGPSLKLGLMGQQEFQLIRQLLEFSDPIQGSTVTTDTFVVRDSQFIPTRTAFVLDRY
jgi:hypothetical protein